MPVMASGAAERWFEETRHRTFGLLRKTVINLPRDPLSPLNRSRDQRCHVP